MTQLSRQAQLVCDHLFTESHLTSWQAEGVYRIRRLASRVSELKNAGFVIAKERGQDATGQTYTRYSFSKAQRKTRKPINSPVRPQRRFTLDEVTKLYVDYCVHMDYLGVNDDPDSEAKIFRSFMEARA